MENGEARRRRNLRSGVLLAGTMALAFAVVAGRLLEVATGPAAPTVGNPAPAFAAETVGGRSVALEDFEGQVVLLDFWATWCPPCVASMPHLERLHREHADQGLVVLGVNQEPDRPAHVQAFLRRHDITFPSIRDDANIAGRYGVYSFPTTVLVGPDQRVLRTDRGPVPPDRLARSVREALEARNPGASGELGARQWP